MEARPETAIPGFRILRELGRGGLGVVYEAEQASVGRKVALKVYHSSFVVDDAGRRRFEREAKVAAHIQHPHILPIFTIGDVEGVPYLAMEYVEGASLDKVVEALRGRPLDKIRRSTFLNAVQAVLKRETGRTVWTAAVEPEDDVSHVETAVQIVLMAAEAMQAAHEKGISHRDLKPANLLVRADGHLFVSDFGLARDETLATLTRTGFFQGTPQYLSPEQTLGDRKAVDHRTDIYSLGATLHELLTLEPLHSGTTTTEVLKHIVFSRPTPATRINPLVPPDLALVVARCTERNPKDRYQGMASLAADLRRFLDHEAIAIDPIGPLGRSARWVARHARVSALLLAAALTIVGALWWSVASAGRSRKTRDLDRAAREERLVRTLAAAEEHRSAGRLERAKSTLDSIVADRGEARYQQEFERLGAAVVEAADRDLTVVERPITTLELPAAKEASLRLEALRKSFGGSCLSDRVQRLEAGVARVEALKRGETLHPLIGDLLSGDPATRLKAIDALCVLFLADGTLHPSLAIQGLSRGPLRKTDDYLEIGTDEFPDGAGICFAGYLMRSADPPYDDLLGLDARGKVLLCFRHSPGFERGSGRFSAGKHALLAEKVRHAREAGAVGVLVVDRPLPGAAPGFTVSSESRSEFPVYLVRGSIAKALVARAGKDLGRLREGIDGSLRPQSFPIPGASISRAITFAPDSRQVRFRALVPLLTELIDALEAEARAAGKAVEAAAADGSFEEEPPGKPYTTRRMLLGMLASIPGEESAATLRAAIRSGDLPTLLDVAVRAFHEHRYDLAPDLVAVLEAALSDPGPWLADAPDSFPAVSRAYDWDQRRRWHGEVIDVPLIVDQPTGCGVLLAALLRLDRSASDRLAREWILKDDWGAAYVLHRSADSAARGLVADAQERVLQRLDALSASPEYQSVYDLATKLCYLLAKTGDARCLRALPTLAKPRHAGIYGFDLDEILELLAPIPGDAGTVELVHLYLKQDSLAYARYGVPRAAAALVRGSARFATMCNLLEPLLAPEAGTDLLRALELLRFEAGLPPLPAPCRKRVRALLDHRHAVVRARALAATDTVDNRSLASARQLMKEGESEAKAIVKSWLLEVAKALDPAMIPEVLKCTREIPDRELRDDVIRDVTKRAKRDAGVRGALEALARKAIAAGVEEEVVWALGVLWQANLVQADLAEESRAALAGLANSPSEVVRRTALATAPLDELWWPCAQQLLESDATATRQGLTTWFARVLPRAASAPKPVFEGILRAALGSGGAPAGRRALATSLGWAAADSNALAEALAAPLREAMESGSVQGITGALVILGAIRSADGNVPEDLAERAKGFLESKDPAVAVLALAVESGLDDRTKAAAQRCLRSLDPDTRKAVWGWLLGSNRFQDLLDEGPAAMTDLLGEAGRPPPELLSGVFAWLVEADVKDWDPARFAVLLVVVRRIDPGEAAALARQADEAAWRLVDPAAPVPAARDLGLALAELAVKGSESKDGAMLDTLACALALCERWDEAVEVERRAIEMGVLEHGGADRDLVARLRRFESRAAAARAAK